MIFLQFSNVHYVIFNEEGELIKTLPHSIGKLCRVHSDSFAVENEHSIDFYNMTGEIVGSKPSDKY